MIDTLAYIGSVTVGVIVVIAVFVAAILLFMTMLDAICGAVFYPSRPKPRKSQP